MKKLLAALAGAVIAGLAVGAAARLLMRAVSLTAGADSGFSFGGTLGILLTFVVLMVPGALLAAFTTRRWRWVPLVAATGLLSVVAFGIAKSDLEGVDLSGLRVVAVGITTLAVFACIVVLPVVTVRVIDRLLGRSLPSPA